MSVESPAEAENAAKVLIERGAASVILTLGERGSLLVTGETTEHVPVEPVKALDTTGAGDAFVGSWKIFVGFHQTSQRDCSRQRPIIKHPDQFS